MTDTESKIDKPQRGRPTKFAFSGKDICEIIAACHKAEAIGFEFGDLKIEFGKRTTELESPVIPIFEPEQQKQVDEHTMLELEQERKLEELSRMAILRPHEYEQLEMSGDLDDGKVHG